MDQKRSLRRRALSLLMALTLILGLLPAPALAAEAAPADHWAASYLNQMVEWGFIRADQAQNPDKKLTRADFMSIVNRAYGYHEVGPTPFEDVNEYDWFYDDVGIAYTARYINGTSPTTASPNDTLDRETAATILGRNMMLQESAGEILDFSDARNISNWARGTIKSSMEHYLVSGYDDGTFRPQQAMSWGEIAALVTRTIGTPLQDAGDYALGGVFGNVTVTSPGVTLRDTVISGDLYITGGVGLGGIKLENVTVLGRIIASGTGTSEGGASILLRNVTADELLVDNLQDKEVSVRADGITEIGKTTVRSSAYIEDNTPDGLGLHLISLEGDWYGEDEEVPEGWTPPQLTLAGRVEEVINKTPNSTVHAAKGTVAKLTVDEEAVGSNVVIDRGTVIKELVLDTGVNVTGEGDIKHLEVNAPGSNVAMLPDEIVIRPGITAIIAGEEMDSMSAEEFLLDPMILAGYPKAKDITPTSVQAVFSTNKQGTIHWAVSTITDGSVGVDELLEPPSYGAVAMRHGTLTSPRGNEETSVTIAGLTPDGSYYLSAVLEDARGEISPLKVISFTTPDNSVPAFNQGYPYMSKTSRSVSQATVSVSKACTLYYALYAVGATAPTVDELKTGSVAGSYGYGVVSLEKNTEFPVTVNNRSLKEQENYIVYFWLTDGINSSAITSLTFTTDDETLPYFLDGYPRVTAATNNSVTLTFRINENGRVFWVVRPEGDTTYPLPQPGQTGTAPLDSLFAKTQVAAENPAINAVADTDGRIVINGLEPEKAYDLYYLCQDTAGNYCLSVEKMTIRTADGNGPRIIGQYFDSFTGTDNTQNPKADTGIDLVFSENICSRGTIQTDFNKLYQETKTAADRDQAIANLVTALRESIVLQKKDATGNFIPAVVRDFPYPTDQANEPAWDIDYSLAEIFLDSASGRLTVTFPDEALNLESGGTYRFIVSDITDNATPTKNLLIDENDNVVSSITMPEFNVVFASVTLSDLPDIDREKYGPQKRDTSGKLLTDTIQVVKKDEEGKDVLGNDGKPVMEDKTIPRYTEPGTSLYFRMTVDSTEAIDERIIYDILLWNQETLGYQLYYRIVDKDARDESASVTKVNYLEHGVDPLADGNETIDEHGWIYLGDTTCKPRNNSWQAQSVSVHINGCGPTQFPKLSALDQDLAYEFIIDLTYADSTTDVSKWSGQKDFRAQVVASSSGSKLYSLAGDTERRWAEIVNGSVNTGAAVISNLENPVGEQYLEWYAEIHDNTVPKFASTYPQFLNLSSSESLGDDSITLRLGLDRKNAYVYYLLDAVGEDGDLPFTPSVPATIERPLPAMVELETVEVEVDDPDNPGQTKKEIQPKYVNGKPVYKIDETTQKPILAGANIADEFKAAWVKDDGTPVYLTKTAGVTTEDPNDPNIATETIRNPVGLAGATAQNGTIPLDPDKVPLSGNDTPDGLPAFKVILPSVDAVVNPKGEFGANLNTDLYGEISFGNATSLDYLVGPEIQQKLKPSTTYLVYFVLKGQYSEESEVYVYKFTTAETVKPRIRQLSSEARGAKIGDLDVRTHVAAYGQFRVVTSTAAEFMIDDLKKDFAEFVYTADDLYSRTGGASSKNGKRRETPPCYTKAGFTVLDALTTSYRSSNQDVKQYENSDDYYVFPESGTGYTVFDYYANEEIRGKIYNVIQSENQNAGDKKRGSYNTVEALPSDRDKWYLYTEDTGLTADQEGSYYNLVYAVNENAELKVDETGAEALLASFYAYKFRIGELQPVAIDDVSIISLTPGSAEGTYSGRVRVTFEKTTRLYNSEGRAIVMTDANLLRSPGTGKFTTFEDEHPEKVSITAGSTSTSSFELTFTNVNVGTTVGAGSAAEFSGNYFANEDNEHPNKRLTFTLRKTKTGVELVVTWGSSSNVVARLALEEGTEPQNLQLNFDGLQRSGNDYLLTLDGNETKPYERTVRGRLDGVGKIFRVNVSPVNGNSKLANTNAPITSFNTDGSFDLTFTAKAIGSNEAFTVSASVEDSNGNTRTITRTIRVTVTGSIVVESVTPNQTDKTTITPNPSGTPIADAIVFDWDRKDNSPTYTAVITLKSKSSLGITSGTEVSANSSNKDSLSVNDPVVSNGKVTVTMTYKSSAGGSADVTIKVGMETKVLTIYLKGANDSNSPVSNASVNPWA